MGPSFVQAAIAPVAARRRVRKFMLACLELSEQTECKFWMIRRMWLRILRETNET